MPADDDSLLISLISTKMVTFDNALLPRYGMAAITYTIIIFYVVATI